MATPIGQLSVDLLLQSTEFCGRSIARRNSSTSSGARSSSKQHDGPRLCWRSRVQSGRSRAGWRRSAWLRGQRRHGVCEEFAGCRYRQRQGDREYEQAAAWHRRQLTDDHDWRPNAFISFEQHRNWSRLWLSLPRIEDIEAIVAKNSSREGGRVKKRLDDPKVRIFKRGVVREAAGRDRGERVRTRLNPPPAYAYAFRRARIWQGAGYLRSR